MKMILTSNYPPDFIEYLKRQMRLYIYAKFPTLKTSRMQMYFVNELKIVYAPRAIAVMASNNLKSHGYINGKTEIVIDNKIKIPGSDLKLVDACKLINFGAAGVPGYPIFTEMFNYFENNAEELYKTYKILGDIF